ncbi:MAG: hypothetical protein WCG34_11470 [Leptolinea sp.]
MPVTWGMRHYYPKLWQMIWKGSGNSGNIERIADHIGMQTKMGEAEIEERLSILSEITQTRALN